ncbi:MAG: glycosyltransferase family 4 protein [Chloroflexi bacterium]|nr:MAG: glycosyltransferase family 4 protein [Chloroflexota bacterium]
MHIAFFTNTYHPVISGVVRSISTFRQALSEMGHNVFIFAQAAADYKDEEPFIFRYPAIDLPLTHNFPVAIPISPFVDKVLPILKPEVIHSHHPFLLGQAAASKANELNLPLVFTYHTRYREYSHYVSLKQDFVKEAIDRWVGDYLEKCHHIITPSESIRRLLVETYGISRQITVIPTGIDLQPYQAADRTETRRRLGWDSSFMLISVGRLAKEKNWSTLLDAAARVMQSRPHVRLTLIGDGDERQPLEEQARRLGIADRVTFTGILPFDQIPLYLKAADLFCFASVTETQGLVTMEAMAAGLPVAAVNATGTADVVEHNRQGLLTANNSHALADAIARLVDDDSLRREFQQAALEKAGTFDIQVQARRLVEVYRQAIEDRAAGRMVPVDRRKRIFKLIIDDEQWVRLFSREKKEDRTG